MRPNAAPFPLNPLLCREREKKGINEGRRSLVRVQTCSEMVNVGLGPGGGGVCVREL